MSRTLIVIAGLLLLGLLAWYCGNYHGAEIERDLVTRSSQALLSQGYGDVAVLLSGRDLTLTGKVADAAARQQAERIATQVTGVRTVANQLVVAPPKVAKPAVADPAPDSVAELEPEPVASEPVATAAERAQAAAVSCQQRFDSLLENDSIEFESNGATIKPVSFALLDALVAVAQQCPAARIEIAGHTDSSGRADYNKALSERRAGAVLDFLSAREISLERLSARGFGEAEPIASNRNAAGRAKNRRVELIVEGV